MITNSEKSERPKTEKRPAETAETLYQRAYGQLKDALMTGAYRPGQKITIRTTAIALGMSMTPVREALRSFAAEGALEILPNQSVRVPPLSLERLRHLTGIRVMVEGHAAEGAAASHDRYELAEALQRIQINLSAARDRRDFAAYIVENERFHFTLYRAGGNPILLRLIESLWLQAGPMLTTLRPAMRDISLHTSAIQAIMAGDPSGAREAIAEDIRRAARHLEAFVSKHEEAEEADAVHVPDEQADPRGHML